jgi:hypothetical protein
MTVNYGILTNRNGGGFETANRLFRRYGIGRKGSNMELRAYLW